MDLICLPTELLELIIEYVNPNDTINLSLVSLLWKTTLENMFETNSYYHRFETIQNDSFALKMYLLKFDAEKSLSMIRIADIYSNNCLNCITYNMCIIRKCPSNAIFQELLIQFCILNNMSKPSYIKLLLNHITCDGINKVDILNEMLDICLCVESFKVADYLLLLGASSTNWLNTIPVDCYKEGDHIKILNSLKYLISRHAICLPAFINNINNKPDFIHKDDIIKFAIFYLHDDILDLIGNI